MQKRVTSRPLDLQASQTGGLRAKRSILWSARGPFSYSEGANRAQWAALAAERRLVLQLPSALETMTELLT